MSKKIIFFHLSVFFFSFVFILLLFPTKVQAQEDNCVYGLPDDQACITTNESSNCCPGLSNTPRACSGGYCIGPAAPPVIIPTSTPAPTPTPYICKLETQSCDNVNTCCAGLDCSENYCVAPTLAPTAKPISNPGTSNPTLCSLKHESCGTDRGCCRGIGLTCEAGYCVAPVSASTPKPVPNPGPSLAKCTLLPKTQQPFPPGSNISVKIEDIKINNSSNGINIEAYAINTLTTKESDHSSVQYTGIPIALNLISNAGDGNYTGIVLEKARNEKLCNNLNFSVSVSLCTGAGCVKGGGEPCDIGGKRGPGINTAIGCIHTNPAEFVKDLLTWVIGIGGGIAFLMMLLGAFQMLTSAGNPETLQAGRDRLTSAVIGLLFIIFSVLLLQIIGIGILNIPGFQ